MLKKKFGSIFAILFLLFLVGYTFANKEILKPLLSASLPLVFVVALMKIAQIFINGLYTKFTLDAFKKTITYKESSYIAMISSLGNYFGPLLGGMGVRATYLKKKHSLSVAHFVGTLYGYYLITFFTTALIGLAGCALVYFEQDAYSWIVILSFMAVMVATGVLFFVKVPKTDRYKNRKYLGSIYAKLMQVNEGWEYIINHKGLLTKLLVLGFSMLVISFATSFLEFEILGLDKTLGGLLVYTAIGGMSLLVSVTPGAIGVRESLYIFSASILLLTNAEILQLASIDRGISLAVLMVTYVYLQFTKRIKHKNS